MNINSSSILNKQFAINGCLLSILTFLVLAQACTKTDDVQPLIDVGNTTVLILNEGLFRRGNASISGYDAITSNALGTVYDPSITSAGGLDILQSVTELGDTLVLIANNSNAIVLLDKDSLQEIARFEALGSPRYLTRMKNGQLLVTDLYANRLLELNPDFTEARIIRHEGQAEGVIAFREGALFASPDRKMVFYYDAQSGMVADSFTLQYRVNALVAIDENRVAFCAGILEQGEAGGLGLIDWRGAKSMEILAGFRESESSLYPRIVTDENRLYCLQRRALVMLPLNNLSISNITRIELPGIADPYGLGVDPVSNELYIADAKNGLGLGIVLRMDAAGSPIDTFEVGIFPNGFVFR